MTIDHIMQATDWHKKWMVVDFCLFGCSFLVDHYHSACIKRFGTGFSHQFFVYKNNAVTTYLSVDENNRFGQTVAAQIMRDTTVLDDLHSELMARTEDLRHIMREPVESFLTCEGFEKFETKYREYLPPYVGLTRSGDWLVGDVAEHAMPILDRARLTTESGYNETDAFIQRLANSVREKSKSEYDLRNCLTSTEFVVYLRTRRLPAHDVLESRKQCNALYGERGESEFITAEDAARFEAHIARVFGAEAGIAKGQTAFPGVVKGKVRIVHNPSHAGEFNEGDILITEMTRPDFVPLMKKAGAIVTDGGGILCHAAIVSREFKTPCIIGTQTATQAFKDGDIVEVDASKGIVKKI